MFVREKTARGHRYLYLVESVRDGGRVRQQIVRALGRKDVLLASGELDRLVASLARHSERAMILSEIEAGRLSCTRIGGPLLFGRLWERLGIADVLADLLRGRGFDFAVERAVFVAVLHRLFVSASDRACDKWMADYAIPGSGGLQLHHFYRAVAWLGEETAPIADGELAPRCIKDVIEEQLFERDLFGVDKEVPVGLREIRLRFELDTDELRDLIATSRKLTEQGRAIAGRRNPSKAVLPSHAGLLAPAGTVNQKQLSKKPNTSAQDHRALGSELIPRLFRGGRGGVEHRRRSSAGHGFDPVQQSIDRLQSLGGCLRAERQDQTITGPVKFPLGLSG
jgi:hypothetical protein